MPSRRRPHLLASALLLSLVAACGGGESSTNDSDAAPGELTHLNIGDIKIASQTSNYVADKMGFFEDHGLDVEFTYASGGQDILTAVQSGSLDIGLAIPGVAVVANTQSFDFVAVVQNEVSRTEGPDTGGLLVRSDDDIKSLRDLEGRSVAVVAKGANQVYVATVQALLNEGVDPSTVTFQEIPFPQMGEVLAQGQVDAIAQVDPFTTALSESGAAEVLSWYYVEALPEMPLGAMWAQRSWVEENPEVAAAYHAAISDAHDYLLEDEDRARDLIAEFTGLERGMLDAMPVINWDSSVDTAIWEDLIQMYVDQGLVEDGAVTVDSLLSEVAAG
jgi:NitT/TauT family transport system substrate-binding protein